MPPFNISIDHQMSILHHFWLTLLCGKSTQSDFSVLTPAINIFNSYFKMVVSFKAQTLLLNLFLLQSQCTCWLPSGGFYFDRSQARTNWLREKKANIKHYRHICSTALNQPNFLSKSQREKDGGHKNVLEAERGKKDVYICSSMQGAHVCVSRPSVIYSKLNDECILFQSPLLTLDSINHYAVGRSGKTT